MENGLLSRSDFARRQNWAKVVHLLASGTKGTETGKEWSRGLLKEQGGVSTREREQEKAATRWRSAARGGDALWRIEAEGDGSYATQSESPRGQETNGAGSHARRRSSARREEKATRRRRVPRLDGVGTQA